MCEEERYRQPNDTPVDDTKASPSSPSPNFCFRPEFSIWPAMYKTWLGQDTMRAAYGNSLSPVMKDGSE